MATKVDICNIALRKLGTKTIQSMDDGSMEADVCKLMYEVVRDAELRKHPWNFASKQSTLAKLNEDPIVGYGAGFRLPSDCIRVEKSPNLFEYYTIKGRTLYTIYSTDSVTIDYIGRLENSTLYDPLFVEVFATRLAIEMCAHLTQSLSKKNNLYGDYQDYIKDAKRTNAIEKPFRKQRAGTLLTIRGTSGTSSSRRT